jgi:integrase/recombinase XerC
MRVERVEDSFRIVGDPTPDIELANRYLSHLEVRAFAVLTVRTYAFHGLGFLRFCEEQRLALAAVTPMDVFDFLDWLSTPPPWSGAVVALRSGRGASAATMTQRIAAIRGLFEFDRIASDTPTAPTSLEPEWICWSCAN